MPRDLPKIYRAYGGKIMNAHARTRKHCFAKCVLLAILLFCWATAQADVVLDWNAIAVNTAIANGQNPFAQARYGAIVQLAVFEAVNAITGDYQPYLGTIKAAPGASADAAAAQAAYRCADYLFPEQRIDAPSGAREFAGADTGRPGQE